jgi:hypothetical protein
MEEEMEKACSAVSKKAAGNYQEKCEIPMRTAVAAKENLGFATSLVVPFGHFQEIGILGQLATKEY